MGTRECPRCHMRTEATDYCPTPGCDCPLFDVPESDPSTEVARELPCVPAPGAAAAAVVTWPWGEVPCADRLFVGRVPPVPAELASRLERDYRNVSRMHAEIRVREQGVTVRDLGSLNGTFINDVRLPEFEEKQVEASDRIRFAGNLEISIASTQRGGAA